MLTGEELTQINIIYASYVIYLGWDVYDFRCVSLRYYVMIKIKNLLKYIYFAFKLRLIKRNLLLITFLFVIPTEMSSRYFTIKISKFVIEYLNYIKTTMINWL